MQREKWLERGKRKRKKEKKKEQPGLRVGGGK